VVHVNRTLSDRFAHPRDRLYDRPLRDIVGEEARTWLASLHFGEAGAHDPATYAKELDDEVLGGRFTMTLTPVPGTVLGGQRAVFVARDITKQARLEIERRELLHRLAQAEKRAAVREVARRIARKLQSPLETVAARAASLGTGTSAPPAIRKEAAALSREAVRTLGMVEELLAAAGGATKKRLKASRA
jgi:signal transduction histidine kinase